jgi:hypothetical protein
MVATVVLALVVAAAAVVFFGVRRWDSETNDLFAGLEAARTPVPTERYNPEGLDGLPLPVQRYLHRVLREGQPMVSAVWIRHTGSFNLSATGEQWRPFTSRQRIITRRAGFVWEARIRTAPAVDVRVHDAYLAGAGVLCAKLYGLVKVMEQPDSPELAQGELMRFLAEAVWYPTALLPNQGVRWRELDDARSAATLTDGSTTVELAFSFDDRGLLRSVRSEERYREVNGILAATPWEGRFWDYAPFDGMLIPKEGEVAWLGPAGRKPYWRGRIRSIEYEYGAE